MENRAAVFTSQPQDVEVYRRDAWQPGSLLGWRHDSDGLCQVWVRLVGGGADETIWTALEYLRLPEPAAPPVRSLSALDAPLDAPPRASGDAQPPLTGTMAAIRPVPVPAPRPAAAPPASCSELTATMNLFAVRDDDDHGATAAAVRGGRSGGRRRAPDRTDAVERAQASPPVAAGMPGRHRAPAPDAAIGRHRAADTGVRPAVRADQAPEGTPASLPGSAAVLEGPDVNLLTRPMRLDDVAGRVSRSRRSNRDAWPAGR
jgi:hypothetical protein